MGILIRVDDSDGIIRQNKLGAQLGWDRSRLSHQITRMEAGGLLERTRVRGGVEIGMRPDGQTAVDAARPLHARAVHEHLIVPLRGETALVRMVLDDLAAPREAPKIEES